MYIPQIQPVQRNDSLLINAARNIAAKRQQDQLSDLLTKAAGGDQASLIKAAALSPESATAVQKIQETQRQQLQQAALGGLATLWHAPAEQRAEIYNRAAPLLKQRGLSDLPDQYPGDDWLVGTTSSIAAQGGDAGTFATTLLQNSGAIPQKPTDTMRDFMAYKGMSPEDRKAFAEYKNFSGGNGPASLQEFAAYNAMTPEQKREFLLVKRANPYVDLGGTFAQPDPLRPGQTLGSLNVTQKQSPAPAGVTPNASVPQQVEEMANVEAAKQTAQKSADVQVERAANAPVAKAALTEALAGADRMKATAQELLKNPGVAGITGWQGLLPNAPGGKAADAKTVLNNLVSQAQVSVMGALKAASATGATGFGALSEKEGTLLQNFIASLSLDEHPSEAQFKANVKKIADYVDGFKSRLQSAYDQVYGGQSPMAAGNTNPSAPKQRRPLSSFGK